MKYTTCATRYTSFVIKHIASATKNTTSVTKHTASATKNTTRVTKYTTSATKNTTYVTKHTAFTTKNTIVAIKHTVLETKNTGVVTKQDACAIKQDGSATKQDACAIKQGGFATKQGNCAIKQDGFATKQGACSTKQDGFATKQGACAIKQDGFATKQGACAIKQDGSATKQDACAIKQDGIVAKQGNCAIKQDGSTTKQGACAIKQGGFATKQGACAIKQGDFATKQGACAIKQEDPEKLASLNLVMAQLQFCNSLFQPKIDLRCFNFESFISRMDQPFSGNINAGHQQLHYLKMGNGEQLLIAFHGYGNEASIFNELAELLKDKYTIYSIDLPHHGHSIDWPEGLPFMKEDLVSLVHNVLEHSGFEKCTLAGYSMGGRVCLNIIEMLPELVEKVLLIAPDGLMISPFYFFVTRTRLGKMLFRNFLRSRLRKPNIVDWIRKLKLVNLGRYRFAQKFLNSDSARDMLLKVWPTMRYLIPRPRRVKRHIALMQIPVYIFMGTHDRIIPVRLAETFRKGLNEVRLFILNKGHHLIDKESVHQMAECLL